MIRLVALDLDGTILDPYREAPIRPAVVEAVQLALQKGVGVTLATGRTWEYAHIRARELGIRELPLITGQGSTLAEAESGRLLHEEFLPEAIAARLATIEETVVCLYFRAPDGTLHIVQNRMEREPAYYHHLLGPQAEIADLRAFLRCKALKAVFFTPQPGAVQSWQERLGPSVNVVRTHDDLVEVTGAGVDKGSGLARLREMLGLRRDHVMAIGDNENDLPMFREAGLAVAMGQAPQSVREAAHWVAPAFEDDGAAAAIQRFLLG